MTKQGQVWTWVIVAIIVIFGGWYLLANTSSNTTVTPETNTQSDQSNAGQGRVVFSVTDAALDMSTISEINMKINSVDMHNPTTDSWVNVSSTPKSFDLLALNSKNESDLLADTTATPGTYDQVRLAVDSVSLKMKDGTVKTAKLPSGELKLNTKVVVAADNTASVNFDFLADKSLHLTGNGTYIFAPVIKTSAKSNAAVTVDANNVVSISGGNDDDESNEGMDIDGSIKPNFVIDGAKKLEVDASGKIKAALLKL